jgi:ubiquinone/menaquinone biosynthesis C-methylase UbiE
MVKSSKPTLCEQAPQKLLSVLGAFPQFLKEIKLSSKANRIWDKFIISQRIHMRKQVNDFNSVAGIYDPLSKLVFGNRLIRAQEHFLGRLPTEGRVLFIGGGSGEVLPKIWSRKPRLEIDYIDASQSMINLAEKKLRQFPSARTNFICGTEADIEPDVQYDAILTFFFLDIFKTDHKFKLAQKLKSHLNKDGIWLHADFQAADSTLSALRERLMFGFLKATSKIEANEISNDERIFNQLELRLMDRYEFGRRVYSAVFQTRIL